MYRFMRQQGFDDYETLYEWSIDDSAAFWEALCRFCDIHFAKPPETVLKRPDNIMNAGWFDGGELNYAEHLLRHEGEREALVFSGENGERRSLSFDELRDAVAGVAAGLKRAGVVKGDRVGGYLPNCPEAIIAMLATTSIGAIWSSCSPDFGVTGVVDRFGQIEPKVLFTANAYFYNGKRFDCLDTVAQIVKAIPAIERTVVVSFAGAAVDLAGTGNAVTLEEFAKPGAGLTFEPVAFDHPLFIMYSSGTTGVPKCIVHGHGGTLLQIVKEHVLHCDTGPGDRLFYFTTCGWMMWNWLVTGLATGATLVLFDGSPFYDDGRVLWQMAEREKLTVFGTSAKYISALQKAGVRPRDEFDLPDLRAVLSTGSPLAPESFDYVYDAIGSDLQLSSIAGGTDIISCFVLGNPTLPVRRGEIQCRGLGMAVAFFDDEGVIHGRSDSVLNPGGVRIGTAEIYRQVEKLDDVVESIAVGQDWDDDVRVVLFVVLRPGVDLDDALCDRIRRVIRENTTPRHVPAKIVAVPEIPRTKSGKIVEIAVRSVVHGEDVKNTEALANPGALQHFRNIPELGTD
jgi:acetoacetyl-CoA synthetase